MLTTLAHPASGIATVGGPDTGTDPLAPRHRVCHGKRAAYDTPRAAENLVFIAWCRCPRSTCEPSAGPAGLHRPGPKARQLVFQVNATVGGFGAGHPSSASRPISGSADFGPLSDGHQDAARSDPAPEHRFRDDERHEHGLDRKAGVQPQIGIRPLGRNAYAGGNILDLAGLIPGLAGVASAVAVATFLVQPSVMRTGLQWAQLSGFMDVTTL